MKLTFAFQGSIQSKLYLNVYVYVYMWTKRTKDEREKSERV